MRPFQMIIIGVFALLAIVGIIVFANYSGLGGGNAVGTVAIWGTLPADAIDDALNNVKQTHKEYAKVSYTQVPAENFDATLANAIASGAGPDLIIINQEQLLAEEPKLTLIPFSSISLATFNKTYVAESQLYLAQSGTYGIPLVVDPIVLYYNRTLLSSAGIPSTVVTGQSTPWSAITGLASVLTKVNGQTITRSAVPFGGYANVTNARAIVSLLFLQAGSAITQNMPQGIRSVIGDRTSVASDTGETAAEAAANFYTQFANPAKTVYSWNPSLPSSRQAFISGDLALYPGFASEAASLAAANPNLDFDMAPIPQADTSSGRTTYGLAYAFAIPKASANKTGAYDAALALTSSTVLPSLAKHMGMAPATESMLVADAGDPHESVYYPEALIAKGWLSPGPSAVDGIFSAMITNITTGKLGTADALSAADQSMNAAL